MCIKSQAIKNKVKQHFFYSMFLFVWLSTSVRVVAQDPVLNKVIPPSPTAYELGKYGQVPVGLFTGTPQLSIPVYEYRTNNLSVPVSLSYNSNGIKVDELGSNVGLGWSLNAGGVITRIVRDLPDEMRQDGYPEQQIHENGPTSTMAMDYFTNAANNPSIDSETDQFMFNFNGHSGKFVIDNDHKIVMLDLQPLKIELNMDDLNDGFKITTPDGVQYFFSEKEFTRNRAEGTGVNDPAPFYVTSWYLSSIKHPKGDVVTFTYTGIGYDYITSESQTLTSTPLQSGCPEGSMVGGAGYSISTPVNYRLNVSGKKLTEISCNTPERGKIQFVSAVSHPEVSAYKLVSKINVLDKNNATVETFDLNYLITTNQRAFLKEVITKDPDKKYQMEYIDPDFVPLRLSYNQDTWGYYNGQSNNYLFPKPSTIEACPAELLLVTEGADKTPNPAFAQKGLLSKFTYPTKGYSAFEYEANTYWGPKTIMPPVKYFSLDVLTDDNHHFPQIDNVTITNIKFDQDMAITPAVAFNLNANAGCDESQNTGGNHNSAIITISDLTSPSTSVEIYQLTASGQVALSNPLAVYDYGTYPNVFARLKKDHNYKAEIEIIRKCLTATLFGRYYNGDKIETNDNLIIGGLRIKQMNDYDPVKQNTQTYNYYYGNKETPNQSTGQKGPMPMYIDTKHDRIVCAIPCSYVDIIHYEIVSSSLNSLYNNIDAGTTNYEFVTVSQGTDFANGGEEHRFTIDDDAPGNPIYGEAIGSAPWTNIGIQSGKEILSRTFKKNSAGTGFVLLKEVANTYTIDSRYSEKIYGYSIRKKFELQCTTPIYLTCTQALIDLPGVTSRKCIAQHICPRIIEGQPFCIDVGHTIPTAVFWYQDWTCARVGIGGGACSSCENANNIPVTSYNGCHGHAVGDVLTYPNNLENLDITEYTANSYWNYLASCVTKEYDLNGQNPVITTQNYFYDNMDHFQLTRTETADSKGNVLKTKIYYPDDVTSTTALPGGSLTTTEYNTIALLKKDQQFQIGLPVQTEIYRGADKLTTTRTIFQQVNGTMVLPFKVQTLKGDVSANNVLRDRIFYQAYDAKGNPVEMFKANDSHTSVLWGYNYTLPIAQVENATYAQVMTALGVTGQDISYLQTMTGTTLEAELNTKLRGASGLSQAQINTFTYDPLIGLRSVTKPNGLTTKYEYDTFNRMRLVRDADENILQRYQYHYAVKNTCPADINKDGFVNNTDLIILQGNLGTSCQYVGNCPSDINGDGLINNDDLVILQAAMNTTCN